MTDYEAVIRFTGNYIADPLSACEIDTILAFLDSGGKLLLSGQGTAQWLSKFDNDFLNSYLHADFVESRYVMILYAEAGTTVFDPSDTIVFSPSQGGAGNQSNTDHMSPLNGGISELRYLGGQSAAISYDGDYQLVYFGFGLEAVTTTSTTRTNRDAIIRQVLQFFDFQFPVAAPEATGPGLVSEQMQHVIGHTPDIAWTYNGPDGTEQSRCQIQVGSDADWSSAELWDPGPVATDASVMTYAGDALQDGLTYYLRVRVANDMFWSDWTQTSFHMNSLPLVHDLSPDNLVEVTVNPPVLQHQADPDAEGDAVSFAYELYADAEMTTLIESVGPIPGNPGGTLLWQATTTLTENEDYFWRVRGLDDYETGDWSPPASFVIVPAFICGDANGDDAIDVGDAVFLINYIFKGGPAADPNCSGNANGDGATDVGDAVYLINYVFKGGPPPHLDCCS